MGEHQPIGKTGNAPAPPDANRPQSGPTGEGISYRYFYPPQGDQVDNHGGYCVARPVKGPRQDHPYCHQDQRGADNVQVFDA